MRTPPNASPMCARYEMDPPLALMTKSRRRLIAINVIAGPGDPACRYLPLEKHHRAQHAEARPMREDAPALPGQAGYEVETEVPHPPEVLLDRRSDEPQRVQVEPDVEETRVEEHARDHPVPLALRGHKGSTSSAAAAGVVEARALRNSATLAMMSAFVTGALPVAIPCARWTFGGVICGGFFRPLPRGRGSGSRPGIGADRPSAVRAREAGLLVGMPVAVAGLGEHCRASLIRSHEGACLVHTRRAAGRQGCDRHRRPSARPRRCAKRSRSATSASSAAPRSTTRARRDRRPGELRRRPAAAAHRRLRLRKLAVEGDAAARP